MLSAPLMFTLSPMPRRPAGDTFLSLSLLLNESLLRSRHSICVSTGAPFLPLTSGGLGASPCRGANITPAPSVQAPSIWRSTRWAGPVRSMRSWAITALRSTCESWGCRSAFLAAPDRASQLCQDSVQQSRMHVLELVCSLLHCMRNAPQCPMYIWTKGGRKDQHRPRRGRALRCERVAARLGTIDRGILVK